MLSGDALPKGWTGKLWAIQQGLSISKSHLPAAKFILMTDADVAMVVRLSVNWCLKRKASLFILFP